jgi:hypothetical protein
MKMKERKMFRRFFTSNLNKFSTHPAQDVKPTLNYFPTKAYKPDHWAVSYPKLSDKNFIAILNVNQTLMNVKLNPSDARGYRSIVTIIHSDMSSTLNRPYTFAEKSALQLALCVVAEAYEKSGCPIVQQQIAGNNSLSLTADGLVQIGNANEPNMLHGHIIARGNPQKSYIGNVILNGPLPNIMFNMRGDGAEEGNKSKLKWTDDGMNAVANQLSKNLYDVIKTNQSLLNNIEITQIRPSVSTSNMEEKPQPPSTMKSSTLNKKPIPPGAKTLADILTPDQMKASEQAEIETAENFKNFSAY